MRTARLFFALLLISFAVSSVPESPAQQSPSSAEHKLFDAVNRERRANGLPALKWDEALASAARRHAAEMSSHGSVSHQLPGEPSLPARARQAGAQFTWLAENVDMAPDPATIHDQFMNSPQHRANILDKDMDSVGIGVAERRGQLFAVEDFSKAK